MATEDRNECDLRGRERECLLGQHHVSEHCQSAGRLQPALRSPTWRMAADSSLNSTRRAGTAVIYSTLLPVNPPALAIQRAVAMAIDPAGEVYIATTTAGAVPFPTAPGAFQPATPPANPNGSGVVAKLKASESAMLYATGTQLANTG